LYIAGEIQVAHKDPEPTEVELPVTVNLAQVAALIEEYQASINDIEQSLPTTLIDCGMFLVEVISARVLLVARRQAQSRRQVPSLYLRP
jgi:hypothetical protein